MDGSDCLNARRMNQNHNQNQRYEVRVDFPGYEVNDSPGMYGIPPGMKVLRMAFPGSSTPQIADSHGWRR